MTKEILKKNKIPISIIIVIIISALSSILELFLGILFVVFSLIGATSEDNMMRHMLKEYYIIGFVAISIVGIILIIFGILEAIIAYGLWKLKKWAGILGTFVSAINIYIYLLFPGDIWSILSTNFLPMMIIILIGLGWNKLK